MNDDLTFAIDLIDPQWKNDFLHFLETGDANDFFLDYLSNNAIAQEAFELAFASTDQPVAQLMKLIQPEVPMQEIT